MKVFAKITSIYFCKLFCIIFRERLFENLRMIPHAPGVQMQREYIYVLSLLDICEQYGHYKAL